MDTPIQLVLYTTPDCGVCHALVPKLQGLADDTPGVELSLVDAAADPVRAASDQVFVVPVLSIMVQGKETRRFVRVFSMDEVAGAVHRYLDLLGVS